MSLVPVKTSGDIEFFIFTPVTESTSGAAPPSTLTSTIAPEPPPKMPILIPNDDSPPFFTPPYCVLSLTPAADISDNGDSDTSEIPWQFAEWDTCTRAVQKSGLSAFHEIFCIYSCIGDNLDKDGLPPSGWCAVPWDDCMQSIKKMGVSWQSAFWAVFNLAINTFLQDGGVIVGLERFPTRLLRVSPFFCALDSVYIVICYMVGTASWQSPRRTAASILRVRKLDGENRGHGSSTYNRIASILAILVAIPQLVKLTALRGTTFTCLSSWAYFISYLLIEVTKLLAPGLRPPHDENARTQEDEPAPLVVLESDTMHAVWKYLHLISIISTQTFIRQVSMDLFEVGYFIDLPRLGPISAGMAWQCMVDGLLLFILMVVAAGMDLLQVALRQCVPFIPQFHLLSSFPNIHIWMIYLSCEMPFLLYHAFLCLPMGCPQWRGLAFMNTMLGSVITGIEIVPIALFFFSTEEQYMMERPKWMRNGVGECVLSWVFGLGFLCLTCSHYAFCWDEIGTFKPKWTDSLG